MEKQLAPLPLRSYVLPPLLKLSIVEKRPELIVPLLPLASRSLSVKELTKLITLAHRAGADKEVNRLTRNFLLHEMVNIFNDWAEGWETTAKELIAVIPSDLLAHVRNLAPHGTRRLTKCQVEARNRVLVLIYESLGRKNKAERVA